MSRRSYKHSFVSLLGLAAGLAGTVEAQTTLYTYNGDKANDRFGASVANAGDFNNDGFNDIVVGAPENFNVFLTGEGYARVISGANGSVLATFDGASNQDAFGHAVAGAGDVNGDGFDDVIVGGRLASNVFNQAGMIRVISGQTMAPLYDVTGSGSGQQLGWAVSGCGDVDGDGKDDFVGGAPSTNSNQGMARVFSGVNGNVIHTFTGSLNNSRLGFSVGELDDVNSDGRADILVGSLFEGVYIYSGLDGSVLKHFTVVTTEDVYGKAVCGIDDMDGDGIRDVVIGATQETFITAPPGPGYVEVRSSVTGALLKTFNGQIVNDRFGNALSSISDWNGDSTPDVIVSSVPTNANIDEYAQVISGADGSVLDTFTGDLSGDGMGFAVAGLGDIDGNGTVELVCGAPSTQPNGIASGRARVYSSLVSACGGITNFCVASPNSVSANGLTLSTFGTPSVSSLFFLNGTGGPANQSGIFFYAANQVNIPFGDGIRCVGGTIYRIPPIPIIGGAVSLPLNFGAVQQPILANSTWNFQFWYRDPAFGGAGFNFSDALNINFCP